MRTRGGGHGTRTSRCDDTVLSGIASLNSCDRPGGRGGGGVLKAAHSHPGAASAVGLS